MVLVVTDTSTFAIVSLYVLPNKIGLVLLCGILVWLFISLIIQTLDISNFYNLLSFLFTIITHITNYYEI